MTWDKTLTYKYDNENTRELHVLNVYADPDFTYDLLYVAESGTSELDKVLLSGLVTNSKNVHIELADKSLKTLSDIADKYRLTLDEVVHFIAGPQGKIPLPRENPFTINWDEYDEDENYFNVTFATDIKKDDFMQIWKLVKHKQSIKHAGKTFKRKPVENDKLVYAIFKAKIKNDKFSRIFKNYQNGSLEGYSGAGSQFQTEESLERYYKKHKPGSNH